MTNPFSRSITGALALLLLLCCLATLVELRLIALALLSIAQEVYVSPRAADTVPAAPSGPKEEPTL